MSDARAELEALRRLVRNSNDMLCRHAPDGTYQFVSPACRTLLGYEPDELLGTSPYDLFHPEDLERITASHEQVLETPDRHTVRYRIRHADGHWVWFETTSQTSRDPGTGEVVEIHTSSRDITERRRSGEELRRVNEELARSNAELERFAMVVSHDLRSPLAVMRGALDLLPRVAGELPPRAGHLVERALVNSDELLATVDALLDLARVGRGEVRAEPVDTASLVEGVQELLLRELEDVGGELHVAALPVVLADAAQLRLVFQNLISNAIKFRDPQRLLRVEVTAQDAGDCWAFVVADNGRGFAAEDREVIFEPFGRAATGQEVDGFGIGLATCRRIIERYGGELDAEPLDPGARFRFTLPQPTTSG